MMQVQGELMNKMEVAFPSADPPCELRGDLYLPSTQVEGNAVPAIVVVAGSGVSVLTGRVGAYFLCSTHRLVLTQYLIPVVSFAPATARRQERQRALRAHELQHI